MSALRLGRLPDGTRDIRIIDDGATGRLTFARYGLRPSVSGAYVVAASSKSHSHDKRKGAHSPRRKVIGHPACGRTMYYSGEPCARTPGHGWDCRTAASMEVAAERRRTVRHG